MASRHLSRIAALQALFAADVRGDFSLDSLTKQWEDNTDSLAHDDEDRPFTQILLKGISAKQSEMDAVIVKAAPQWPLEKIAAIDRNILRIGLFELLYGSEVSVPPKVALNESIELAKTFGGESSPKFVNGVLGSVYRDMGTPRKDESPSVEERKQEFASGAVVSSHDGTSWYIALILDPFGKWTLPKSSLREGELSHDAALRAAEEELGLSHVSVYSAIAEHRYSSRKPGEGLVEHVVGYFAASSNKVDLKPKKKDGVLDAKWFREDELDDILMYEDLRSVIESGILATKQAIHE
jgi:N utilization substance protein B